MAENIENPTFLIKRFNGLYRSNLTDKDDEFKQSLNQDFEFFINKDTQLRKSYARLRRLAVTLFSCAVLSLALAVADVEMSRKARQLVAIGLDCNDTYGQSWTRYCPTMLNDSLSPTNGSYFQRWYNSHLQFAYAETIAGIAIKSCLTVLTLVITWGLVSYHCAELTIMRLKRYIPEDSPFIKSPKIKSFTYKFLLSSFFIPPLCDAWIPFECQLIVVVRILVCGIKILKECNELRYHSLGKVLSNLASVKIHTAFLVKTYFLHYPKTILLIVYLVVVGFFPYFVIITEALEGHNVAYFDASWLMQVTVTNLGSGEVRPRGILTRIVVGLGSMIGILSTALWVNVFSQYLTLPNEERRILTLVEQQRILKMEKNKAAACIQAAWWRWRAWMEHGRLSSKTAAQEQLCKKVMWEWKFVRQTCNEVRRNLESEFSTEDTLIVAKHMARRMSENQVKPLIINKRSLNKLTWDRRGSTPFAGISNAVRPAKNAFSHFKKSMTTFLEPRGVEQDFSHSNERSNSSMTHDPFCTTRSATDTSVAPNQRTHTKRDRETLRRDLAKIEEQLHRFQSSMTSQLKIINEALHHLNSVVEDT